MTGKYPARLHITDWIAGHEKPNAKLKIPEWTKQLPHDETTIAELLKTRGYATGHFGKWHLGPETHWPLSHGFDVNIGGNHRGQPPSYFFPYGRGEIVLPGLEQGKEGEYLTDRLADEALAWIEKNQKQPFFIYWPHYTVHSPLQAKKELVEKYRLKAKENSPHKNATYAAMIESLDDSVGRLVAKLEELKLRENTVLVFTSDNGGVAGTTKNLNLRAGKGSVYEGGVRVPLIVSWPAKIKAGSKTDEPAISIDFLPTFASLAGVKELPKDVDGVDLSPVLLQQQQLKREAIYWHYPHYHPGGATPYSAVRAGNWRLVEFFETGTKELYDLSADPLETNDLASSKPEIAAKYAKQLADWRDRVGAQMPTPNPKYGEPEPGKKKKGK
jgi:arylsulfatase A-like enzyme